MSTTTTIPKSGTTPATTSRSKGLVGDGLLATVAAATATSVTAAIARWADVPLTVDGESIPIAGFAVLTTVWSVVGIVLALGFARWARAPRRTFLVVTIVLTIASCIPSLTANADTATNLVLALTHLVAAAIVIPSIARRLDDGAARRHR